LVKREKMKELGKENRFNVNGGLRLQITVTTLQAPGGAGLGFKNKRRNFKRVGGQKHRENGTKTQGSRGEQKKKLHTSTRKGRVPEGFRPCWVQNPKNQDRTIRGDLLQTDPN